MELDPAVCRRAMRAHDPRFDGRFFIGVVTTGIYCRPVCPARPPKPENVRFYGSAAAAAEAGLRPCLRCRPESAPGTPAWTGTSATVTRALRLIDAGALDRGSVDELATSLGIGQRHLTRLFGRHVGAPPLSVARTRRVHFAKRLIDQSGLSMARIARAAGFGSVRRFNATFLEIYGRSPSSLRRTTRPGGARGELALKLPYRTPLNWEALLGFLGPRCIPGVEQVEDGTYRRNIRSASGPGRIAVRDNRDGSYLELLLRLPSFDDLMPLVERVRRLFDLDADTETIATELGSDPLLASRFRRVPGLRVPGAWDPFELSVRAILGQQISVRGATTLSGRLAQRFGESFVDADGEQRILFPTASALAAADLTGIGVPGARAEALSGLARAVDSGALNLEGPAELEPYVKQITALKGLGPWTAHYIAMRALREPDAFPEADLGLLKAAGNGAGKPLRPRELKQRAENWRPWRAYAAMALWQGDAQVFATPKPAAPGCR